MNLLTVPYLTQISQLPKSGRFVVAQYDDNSIIVYQAYRPAIGHFAAKQGYFGGEFSLARMSWIKPNFLWMMYRAGWGTKENQEVILAVHLKRKAFDEIIANVVHSNFVPEIYETETEWKRALKTSPVRLQWDPEHHPKGAKLERRAIQLGLRGHVLARYARDWIIEIEDISSFVLEQYQYVKTADWEKLLVPRESIYPVSDTDVAKKLELSI